MSDAKAKKLNLLKKADFSRASATTEPTHSVSPTSDFEYEVAFSLLKEDEPLAQRLSDLLRGRLSTFLYAEQQKKLIGNDGEQVFAEVFRRKARLVVILYRPEWGKTTWTRIEETAIRGRAYEKGYDFTLLVNLDPSKPVPEWYPRNLIWADLARAGEAVLAGIIEHKVRELGGDPSPETLPQRAARLARELSYQAERRNFREGANYDAAQRVFKEVQTIVDLLGVWAGEQSSLKIVPKPHNRSILLVYERPMKAPICMTVHWNGMYSNVIEDARLCVDFFRGHPRWPGWQVWNEPEQIKALKFLPDLDIRGNVVWYEKPGDAEKSIEMLMEHIAKIYMDLIEKEGRAKP